LMRLKSKNIMKGQNLLRTTARMARSAARAANDAIADQETTMLVARAATKTDVKVETAAPDPNSHRLKDNRLKDSSRLETKLTDHRDADVIETVEEEVVPVLEATSRSRKERGRLQLAVISNSSSSSVLSIMEVTRPAIPTTKTMRVEPATRAKDVPTEAASVDTEVATMDPVTTRLSSTMRSQGTTTTVAKDRTVAIGRTTAAPALPATTTTELRTAVATKDKTTEEVISTTTVACPVAAKAKKGNLSSSVSLENPVNPVKVVKNIEAVVVAAETGEREALQPQLLLRPLPL